MHSDGLNTADIIFEIRLLMVELNYEMAQLAKSISMNNECTTPF